MKTSEVVIVSIQNIGDAVFVNGTVIYERTFSYTADAQYPATEVGQKLATSLGVMAHQIELPAPNDDHWNWESVYRAASREDAKPCNCSSATLNGLNELDDVEVGLYWDRRRYGPTPAPAPGLNYPFHMRLQDQREHSGRLTVAASTSVDLASNTLFATMAIDRVPGEDSDTQAIHIKRDQDIETLIVYKQENGYLLLPPTGATLRPVIIQDDLPAYLIC